MVVYGIQLVTIALLRLRLMRLNALKKHTQSMDQPPNNQTSSVR